MNILQPIGRAVLAFFATAGRFAIFTGRGISHCVRPPFYPRMALRQMVEIGYFSLPVVGLTALFAGMVLALQSYTGFARFSAEGTIANVVVRSITRELGPVLAGLMVAGRIGAAMAAEIGTMRVTEQVDALTTLSTNPMKVPGGAQAHRRPHHVAVLGSRRRRHRGLWRLSGSIYKLGFNPSNYLQRTWDFLEAQDVISGLVKASVFGFIITLMGCYHGYHSRGGAQGVGAATTNAVVSASILILCFDYILTEIFFAQ